MSAVAENHAVSAVARGLLAWYDRHRRSAAVARATGGGADPYRVWLSARSCCSRPRSRRSKPYFRELPRALADRGRPGGRGRARRRAARPGQGLGYYARARNLHRLRQRRRARTAAGAFPTRERPCATLPGIGPYTAAAIAAIAFDRKATRRRRQRRAGDRAALRRCNDPLPEAKPEIRASPQPWRRRDAPAISPRR